MATAFPLEPGGLEIETVYRILADLRTASGRARLTTRPMRCRCYAPLSERWCTLLQQNDDPAAERVRRAATVRAWTRVRRIAVTV